MILLAVLLVGFSACDECIEGEGASQSQVRGLPEITEVELNFLGKIESTKIGGVLI